jgi:hypothetical protein
MQGSLGIWVNFPRTRKVIFGELPSDADANIEKSLFHKEFTQGSAFFFVHFINILPNKSLIPKAGKVADMILISE